MLPLLILSCLASLTAIVLLLRRSNGGTDQLSAQLTELQQQLSRLDGSLKADFRINREEMGAMARENRQELAATLRAFGETFDMSVASFNNLQREKFSQLETRQTELVQQTEKQLDRMRETVDEKL